MSYLPEIHRLLPQAPDAERAALSSFLLAPKEVGALCAERKIGAGHFHFPAHQEIYATMLGLWSEDRPIDFIILTQLLRDRGQLDQVGGAAFITELFLFPTAANARYYLEILEEKLFLRDVIRTCTEYAARSYDQQDEVHSIIAEVQEKIAAISLNQARKTPTMKENIIDAIAGLLDRSSSDGKNVIRTGLQAIDDDCGPLERGNLVVIGGQTKSGKSMLAGQIALNVGFSGKPVLYLSLEMTERELTQRWLSCLGRVDVRRVKFWDEGEHQRFFLAQNTLIPLPLTIVTRTFKLSEVVAASQRAAMRPGEPLAVIVLDYAQLTEGIKTSRDDRRQQEIALISRTCKRLAGQLNVLFILLTQLNDEGRTREARDIENDANLMLEVGHNKETGERGVKVVLARSAPSGQRLKLRIIPEHTRVEDAPEMNFEPDEPKKKKRSWHRD